MKKIFLALVVLVMVNNVTNAQMMQNGDKVIQLGIGLPNIYGYSVNLPAIVGIVDYGVSDKIGIGYLSVGGMLAFSSIKTPWDNCAIIHIMGRGTYHFDFVDITGDNAFENFDIYAGLNMGYRITTNYNTVLWSGTNIPKPGIGFSLFAGAKYALTDALTVFAELSHEVAYLTAGACFKF